MMFISVRRILGSSRRSDSKRNGIGRKLGHRFLLEMVTRPRVRVGLNLYMGLR